MNVGKELFPYLRTTKFRTLRDRFTRIAVAVAHNDK